MGGVLKWDIPFTVYLLSRMSKLTEKIHKLKARVAAEDYAVQEWDPVLDELRTLPMSVDVRGAYEALLLSFPSAAALWTRYAELELSINNHANVKSIFSRCLLSCPHADLWLLYLKFIKKANEGKGVDGMAEVRKAYEFTLDCIGNDIASGSMWVEYVNFLSAPKAGTPAYTALFGPTPPGAQEDAQRIAVLRSTYHRAIAVPTHSLDLLWRMYEILENAGANKVAGKKMLDEQRPRYQAARVAYRDRKRKLESIKLGALPAAPGRGGAAQEQQIALWKEYLEYERSNPQRLEAPPLMARVRLAYDQCLLPMYYFPEVWNDYASWQSEQGAGPHEAVLVLTRAQKALPDCVMLRFAHADLEESQGNVDKAKEVYETLAMEMESEPAQANGLTESTEAAGTAPEPHAPEPYSSEASSSGSGARLDAVTGALVWIQYMRFARRSISVKESRQIFLRAKRWQRCPWHVYAASALIEWRNANEQNVARKIFEKGLEVPAYLTDADFILQYIEFLLDVGDVDNARALFERVITEENNRKSIKLWQRYMQIEYERGDLQAAARLEKRAREALGSSTTTNLQLLVSRYQFLHVWPCSGQQRSYLEWVLGEPRAHFSFTSSSTTTTRPIKSEHYTSGPAPSSGPTAQPPAATAAAAVTPTPTQRTLKPEIASLLPPAIATLLSNLPAPHVIDGPRVDPDMVIEALMAADLSAAALATALSDTGVAAAATDGRDDAHANGVSADGAATASTGAKRKAARGDDDEDELLANLMEDFGADSDDEVPSKQQRTS